MQFHSSFVNLAQQAEFIELAGRITSLAGSPSQPAANNDPVSSHIGQVQPAGR
jgi:hypothetical protein